MTNVMGNSSLQHPGRLQSGMLMKNSREMGSISSQNILLPHVSGQLSGDSNSSLFSLAAALPSTILIINPIKNDTEVEHYDNKLTGYP